MQILTGKRNISSGERDNQLFTLARLMKGINIPYHEAMDRMKSIWYNQVDQTGKFYDLETALKKVERAYGI